MIQYYSPTQEFRKETVIKKSRFIAIIAPIENYDGGISFINSLRKEFSDATHICYGFISDEKGREQKFSDDGEPQGTAGQPILDVIKKRGLKKTIVAVVRYFGGIKLGANGLTSAYSGSSASVVDISKLQDMRLCTMLSVYADYSFAGKVQSILEENGSIDKVDYDMGVTYLCAVDEDNIDIMTVKLMDCTSGNIKIERKNERFYPFPVK